MKEGFEKIKKSVKKLLEKENAFGLLDLSFYLEIKVYNDPVKNGLIKK